MGFMDIEHIFRVGRLYPTINLVLQFYDIELTQPIELNRNVSLA